MDSWNCAVNNEIRTSRAMKAEAKHAVVHKIKFVCCLILLPIRLIDFKRRRQFFLRYIAKEWSSRDEKGL